MKVQIVNRQFFPQNITKATLIFEKGHGEKYYLIILFYYDNFLNEAFSVLFY